MLNTRKLAVIIFLSALIGIVFGRPAAAQTHGPHEHGTASLKVILDQNLVELELDSPLINFISFEHPPRTPEQETEVRRMGEILAKFGELFVPTPAAGCQPKGLNVHSDNIKPALLPEASLPDEDDHGPADHHDGADHDHEDGDHDHEDADHDHEDGDHDHDGEEAGSHHHEDGGVHGDLEARFVLECADPGALKGLEVKLWDKFPSLSTLNVQAAGPFGQRAFTLNSKNQSLAWQD
ncbi:MAG: DUF2796 domain-containing protein [Deltaproteobacteria bacterium]|jgi:hypothetical protein|nr:DUF2796 domain-containing protein [Deltaproteobacteria bacterium]